MVLFTVVSMVVLVLVAWLLELLPLTPSPESFSAAAALSASSCDLACWSSALFCSSSVCMLLSSSISSTLELVIWLVYLQVVMNSPRLCALTRKLTMGLVPF